MEHYSVLMSVYYKENPEYFSKAIQSMMDQTVVTNDFVLVCDGPLTGELDSVIDHFVKQYPGIFNIIRLCENAGIGAAVNIGLHQCKNDLVAKMDADDVSVPDRCEKQLRLFYTNPELTVAGGYIEEFDQQIDAPLSVREVPTDNAGIRKFARRRQPFNNVTVMYRRKAVLAVGGYRSLCRCEDYDLYVRLLHASYYAENIAEVLVKARVGQSGLSRRASYATLKGVVQSRWNALKIGFISFGDFLLCSIGELVIVICPGCIRRFIYNTFLRKPC